MRRETGSIFKQIFQYLIIVMEDGHLLYVSCNLIDMTHWASFELARVQHKTGE